MSEEGIGPTDGPENDDVEQPRSAAPAAGEEASLDGAPVVYVAGMWRRVLAGLADLVCLLPVLALAGWLALRVSGLRMAAGPLRLETVLELIIRGGAGFWGSLALATTLALLYGFLFISTTGSTPGLRLMRVKVINIYGARPEWWRVMIRCGGFIAGLLVLGLGLLWIGFDKEKRGLHDWLSGTYVISNRVELQGG